MEERLQTELKKLINSSRGRAHTDRLVELLRSHQEWHKILIDIYLSDEEPASRRIIWAIDLYADEDPGMIIPYLELITKRLETFSHDALRRHSLRLLEEAEFHTQFSVAITVMRAAARRSIVSHRRDEM